MNQIIDMQSIRAARAATTRENSYRALLDDTCDLMGSLLDPDRVPAEADRLALLAQIDAIREYGVDVVR